ncbi:AAA family ATPase [Micromonospora sp. ANENR4]|uniref:AAA family ATPase n=1 Tax=Micromonospora sp. ANENR4 TaxID=2783662 RepID=UPI00188E9AEA|nr:MoxR family ATPase [Micromonospora sp. ANENR4]MBF5033046.1 AAA family ATPase [Micromonospora sp. ANENR4]
MPEWTLYDAGRQPADLRLPPAPPWRTFAGTVTEPAPPITEDPDEGVTFRPDPGAVNAVNAALQLRRPLLLTGRPGSGKSSLIASVARQLRLGPVLRWHITSRSTLTDALYRYDAIGRLHEHTLAGQPPSITKYLRLGPLGTALLPSTRPRALLIDEIDKSDVDLPSDLLDVFERGEFEIPELARLDEPTVLIREHDDDRVHPVERGKITCHEFPFVVLTSNGEREFPAAFLRRCIRYRIPDPDVTVLTEIVTAHLGADVAGRCAVLIADFADRASGSGAHATDQLLNAVYVVTGKAAPGSSQRDQVVDLLLKELTADLA